MSATPYELRARLLQQAEGILVHKYRTEYDLVRENVHIEIKKDPTFDTKAVVYPTYPSTEDIIVEAEKLYKFVQTK